MGAVKNIIDGFGSFVCTAVNNSDRNEKEHASGPLLFYTVMLTKTPPMINRR